MNDFVKDFDIQSIAGITSDSRKVEKNYLFAALPGLVNDGHEYIDEAIARGASAILLDEKKAKNYDAQLLLLPENELHKTFSTLVGKFYNEQPENIVAVTGTNGKSSVVHFINQIWQILGIKSEALGTLNGGLTTPDPVTLHQNLQKFARQGVTHCALEASSHGLSQYRLDGAKIKVGAFTSFSQDHLDYHKDMEEYLQAKIRLFTEVVTDTAVLNADIPEFEIIKNACSHLKITTYGKKGELKPEHLKNFPLIGEFQRMNTLCALGCVISEKGIDKNTALEALQNLKAAPGRLQHVTNEKKTRHAYIDYAHTPDALETVLKELRKIAKGRLICLFGCGGDRDKEKRPIMGEISHKLADVTIITDDNPRNENSEDIRKQIRKNIRIGESLHDIPSRRSAIAFAVQMLNDDDILLVAGKGHERVQILGQTVEEFDDYVEVKKALVSLIECE